MRFGVGDWQKYLKEVLCVGHRIELFLCWSYVLRVANAHNIDILMHSCIVKKANIYERGLPLDVIDKTRIVDSIPSVCHAFFFGRFVACAGSAASGSSCVGTVDMSL